MKGKGLEEQRRRQSETDSLSHTRKEPPRMMVVVIIYTIKISTVLKLKPMIKLDPCTYIPCEDCTNYTGKRVSIFILLEVQLLPIHVIINK